MTAAMLAGCTGLVGNIKRDVAADSAQTDSVLGGLHGGTNRIGGADGVVVHEGFWLSNTPVKVSRLEALPPVFDEPASFDRNVSSLQEFAERITRLTGLPARVSASATAQADRTLGIAGGSAAGGAKGAGTGAPLPPLPPSMVSGGRNGQSGTSLAGSNGVRIAFRSGPLRALLNTASARFGVFWKFADGSIVFYFTDTKLFQVTAVPGDSKLNADVVSASNNNQGGGSGSSGSSGGGSGNISGSAGGGGGSGGGSQSGVSSNNTADTTMSAQLSVFTSLEASIKAMLSPYGSVVPSPATGSIAVTDTPDVLERVGELMNEENRVLSRQVLVNVTVLTVTLTNNDNYGINWGAVYQALGSQFGIKNTFPTTALNPVTFSASVITPSSRASGTTAMISALSQQGNVRRKTSASVTTLNDQPVPVQVATQQGYLAQISTTNTANVGSQTSLTPGTVTTGFNLTLLPHVLDDGTMMMQFYTNLSELLNLQTVSSGGTNNQSIQVPEIETRNFLQRVAMKSGQTLVLSGYEGLTSSSDQQGTGTPQNPLFGGGVNAARSREVIVILITPVLMAGV